MTGKNDHDEIVAQQLRDAFYRLHRAEKNGKKEEVVKIYKNVMASRRPGLNGLIADLFHGRIITPGSEDAIANEVIAGLREHGYTAFKVTDRKTGIVKVTVSLPHSAH
ncbi:MAG: hypothetical protein NTW66_02260 [Candidatus Magasanikbacteria bacterium]|nr:hypothetical protein [Candidatus Magasanikbacteria bacterium]